MRSSVIQATVLIHRQDLLEYFKSAYKPENCTIFAAGKFDDDAFKQLNLNFGGSWGESTPSKLNVFNFKLNDRKHIFIDRPDAVQSAIRMGRLAINRSHPDFPGFQVLNTLLGGYFGSRLMANIREDKGYTYGIGSAVVSLRDAGYFFIATEVGAEVCNDAINEITLEIELLKNQLVETQELDLVRNYMLGAMLGSLENAFSHADKFKNLYFSKLDYGYYDRYINIVKTITPDEIIALANNYLKLEHFTSVVVGKQI
jgi:zinc protease